MRVFLAAADGAALEHLGEIPRVHPEALRGALAGST